MESGKLIYTLNDADIYERDVNLFRRGQWLNDACINYCLRKVESTFPPNNIILLLDPAVGSFFRLQCSDEDDFRDFCIGNSIADRQWIFIPINDNQGFNDCSTHWSLLVLHVPTMKYWHFDSHGNTNHESAVFFANKLTSCIAAFLNIIVGIPLVETVEFAQQQNGSDCGVYMLLVTEFLFAEICRCLDTLKGCTSSIELVDTVELSNPVDHVLAWIGSQQHLNWSGIVDATAQEYRRVKFEELMGIKNRGKR